MGLDDVEAHRTLAEHMLQQGAALQAGEVIGQGLERWPDDIRLRQLQGLALARAGFAERANGVLAELQSEGLADDETLGLLARTYKDLALLSEDAAVRQDNLARALHIYRGSYEASRSIWTGINAATMLVLLGRQEEADSLAHELRDSCLRQLQPDFGPRQDPYWLAATLGEVSLIVRDWEQAMHWYGKAAIVGEGRLGDLSSTRRNARVLLAATKDHYYQVDDFIPMPRVVIFTGHMIDRPDRHAPRFPSNLEPRIAAAIAEKLEGVDGRIGFAAAACGSDILFHEAIRKLKGESHVILPCNREQFVAESVQGQTDGDWESRFDDVLRGAQETVIVSDHRIDVAGMEYDYSSMVLQGLATLRARELETEVIPLVVWDGKPGDGPGGTASAVKRWRDAGLPVQIIDVTHYRDDGTRARAPKSAPSDSSVRPPTPRNGSDARLMAMFFGDVVKFSELTEAQVPIFVEHFLGGIARFARTGAPYAPVGKNTWGDGLFFVFDGVRDAGMFALEVCEFVAGVQWQDLGLRADLNLRIGLHVGPVHCCLDPITQAHTYFGAHVSRAARIEPVTPPGQVYASQAFAALACMAEACEFRCEYVRQMEWAKRYGAFPTYLVRRTNRQGVASS